LTHGSAATMNGVKCLTLPYESTSTENYPVDSTIHNVATDMHVAHLGAQTKYAPPSLYLLIIY